MGVSTRRSAVSGGIAQVGAAALVVAALLAAACSGDRGGDETVPVPPVPVTPVACTLGAAPLDDLLVPPCGVLLGTIDPPNGDLPIDLAHQEAALSELVGAAPGNGFAFDLVRTYQAGSTGAAEAVAARLESAASAGRIAYLSWKVDVGEGAWARVAAGEFDPVVVDVAEVVASSGRRVFLSLHHEPENDGDVGTPEEYVAMWRHVHDLVEATLAASAGSGRVVWVMNYMGHVDGAALDTVDRYYPGEAYVDWLAYNPYNWAGCHAGAQWRGFVEVAAPLYTYFTTNPTFYDATGKPKPLMIGETGTNEDGEDGRKARWLEDMAASLTSGQLAAIKAVVYFNHGSPRFCDRMWDSSPSSAAAFAAIATDPFFNPRGLDPGVGRPAD
jgi:hypothetical protein